LPPIIEFILSLLGRRTSEAFQDIFLVHFFGLRRQAQRDTALLATLAFADHQSGEISKLSARLVEGWRRHCM
jgi:hypothetical protein